MRRSMTDKRQLMIFEEQNRTLAVESVFLSYCINEVKMIVYMTYTVIFRENNLTCTALNDGLQKANHFIYFAIMNILRFH